MSGSIGQEQVIADWCVGGSHGSYLSKHMDRRDSGEEVREG